MIRDAFSTRMPRVTVHYDKDTPTNASEVLAIDYLTAIGAVKNGERLTPDDLVERLGRALLASDESLQELVRRYAVIVDSDSKKRGAT